MQKHTSAPWRIRGNEIGKRIESDTQSHGMLALIATIDVYDMPEQAEANKRLIASAPALLEALELVRDKLGAIVEMNMTDEDIAKIDAAIAAARGTV